MKPRTLTFIVPLLIATGVSLFASSAQDKRLIGGERRPELNGWVYVHLEGKPSAIGYQHGSLLAAEIEDNKRAIELSTTHETGKTWEELRAIAKRIFWPKVPDEYREELAEWQTALRRMAPGWTSSI